MRNSNHMIGLLNFLTFLLSIPILGGGIWLSTRANTTDCLRFLQWPIIIIGVAIMVISLAGFARACYRNTFLMYVYLWAMFLIICDDILKLLDTKFSVSEMTHGLSSLSLAISLSLSGCILRREAINTPYPAHTDTAHSHLSLAGSLSL
ncbi:unnamed protein product [Camellia sinensis]